MRPGTPPPVIVLFIIGLPPLDISAQVRVTCASPEVATILVGALGTVSGREGVTLLDGTEYGPVDKILDAVTEKVYAIPFVRPVTIHVDVPPFSAPIFIVPTTPLSGLGYTS